MEDLALFAKVRKRGEDTLSVTKKCCSRVCNKCHVVRASSVLGVTGDVTGDSAVPVPSGRSLGTGEREPAGFQGAESKVKCQQQGVIAGFAGWNTTRITHLLHLHGENVKIGQRGKQQEECCGGERQCSNMIKAQLR